MLLDCPAAGAASLRSPVKKPLAPQKQGPAHKPSPALIPGETLRMRAPLSQDTVKFSGWKNQGVIDAARNGNHTLLCLRLNSLNMAMVGKDVLLNDPDKNGNTPLHLATQNGHFKIVRELLERGADPDLKNEKGNTPLILAAANGHKDIAKLLLEENAETDLENQHGDTALIWAAAKGHTEIAAMLKAADQEALIGAVTRGDQAQVEKWLKKSHIDVNYRNDKGETALIWAAYQGHTDIAKLLLEKNAKTDLQERGGETALIWAASKGHKDIVKLLLEKNAKTDLQKQGGDTARMLAEKSGHKEVAVMLKAAEEAQKAKAGSSSSSGSDKNQLSAARNALQAEDFEECWGSLNRIYQSKKQQLFPDLLELAKDQDINVAGPAMMTLVQKHSELPGGDIQKISTILVTQFWQSNLLERAGTALGFMALDPELRKGENEKRFTSKLNEFLKSKDTDKIEIALHCLLETGCPSGNLDYAAMLRDSFDWPTELREKAREVWDRRKDFDEGKALVPTSSHAASQSGKSSSVHSTSSAASSSTAAVEEEEEERSPSEVIMEHFRRKKPLSEYSGNLSALLGNQSAVDYLAQHLKENLALDPKGKQPEGRALKTQARLAEQYKEDTPENIRTFWDQVCRQGIGQTVPQALGLETPKKGLASIAGMEPLKKKLTSQFINPFWWQKDPNRFRRPDGTLPNVKPPKLNGGLLLYGPEGTGKSFIAEKLAEEMDRPHIKLLPSNVLSHWMGKSEQAIRSAFEQAANSKPPAFVIIDEIDSFLSKKNDMAQQGDMKITNELMQQLEDAPKKDVTVIGTTNHIDKLEQAAVRDGRFAVRLEVPPPDRASRLAMWNMFLKDTTADGSLPFTDEERSELARNTRGYSTARIKNLVGQAANQSLEELKDLDLDILKQLIRETGPSYDAQRMQRYSDVD